MLRHYAAVRAQLVASLPPDVTVEDTALTGDDGALVRGQYVILFGGGPDSLTSGRFTAPQLSDSDAEYLYTARCVAVTADGARGVAQEVLDGLVGFKPTIPGRNCHPIQLDDSTAVEPDKNVTPPLWFLDLDFLLISRRG